MATDAESSFIQPVAGGTLFAGAESPCNDSSPVVGVIQVN